MLAGMEYSSIKLEIAGGVGRLTLNRPEKLNSFTAAMHRELAAALGELKAANDLRVVVLTGAGRAFCTGQDLKDAEIVGGAREDFARAIELYYAPLVLGLRALPVPVVAAVNGLAVGAGVSLALACDVVVARKSATFNLTFVKIGILPDTGATYFLPRSVGMARAMGLALTGGSVTAEEAAQWGLIWKWFEDEAFEAEVERLVQGFAQGPTRALAQTKKALYAGVSATLEEQLRREYVLMGELADSADTRDGLAAFGEKRAPRFTGE